MLRTVTNFVTYFHAEALALLSSALQTTFGPKYAALHADNFQRILSLMLDQCAERFLAPSPQSSTISEQNTSAAELPIDRPSDLENRSPISQHDNTFTYLNPLGLPEIDNSFSTTSDSPLPDAQEVSGIERRLPGPTTSNKPVDNGSYG